MGWNTVLQSIPFDVDEANPTTRKQRWQRQLSWDYCYKRLRGRHPNANVLCWVAYPTHRRRQATWPRFVPTFTTKRAPGQCWSAHATMATNLSVRLEYESWKGARTRSP